MGSLRSRERKALCRSYNYPPIDSYLFSLVPGVKAADKENKLLQDRLLDAIGPLSQSFELTQV